MTESLATKIVDDFEHGQISRRQLAARLMGLGAAMAAAGGRSWAQETPAKQPEAKQPETKQPAGATVTREAVTRETAAGDSLFQAVGLDHVALDVVDVPKSRDFYVKHLGLKVIRGDDNALFLGQGRDFFLTLFRAEKPRLNHYCYAIEKYEPEAVFDRLSTAGLKPRREGDRIYFPDADGLTVQLAQRRTR